MDLAPRARFISTASFMRGGGENLGAWGCSTRDGGNSEDSASSFLQIIINIGVYVSSIVRPSAFGLDLIG